MAYKTVNIHPETHALLKELIDSGYRQSAGNGFLVVKKPSKASIIHELVSKLHKKECK